MVQSVPFVNDWRPGGRASLLPQAVYVPPVWQFLPALAFDSIGLVAVAASDETVRIIGGCARERRLVNPPFNFRLRPRHQRRTDGRTCARRLAS
jgi:hypothetical protein